MERESAGTEPQHTAAGTAQSPRAPAFGGSPATPQAPAAQPESTGILKRWLGVGGKKEHHKGDTAREVAETIVFVVVLVLMLKAFVAEAFIIPTGSMATTLLGYHRHAKCDKCSHEFTVNATTEESENGWPQGRNALAAICPHCRNRVELNPRTIDSGDKVLVLKPIYDFAGPERFDVIVFKFPGWNGSGGPQENFAAKNYIKRLWLLPGETPSIWYGDVYEKTAGAGGDERRILRKPPAKIREMRRLVSDNDLPAVDLVGVMPPRWADAKETWTPDSAGMTFTIRPEGQERWLQYRNLYRPPALSPETVERAYQRAKDLDGHLRQVQGRGQPASQELAKQVQEVRALLEEIDVIAMREGKRLKEDNVARGSALVVSQPGMKALESFAASFQEKAKGLTLSDAQRRELGRLTDTLVSEVDALKGDLATLATELNVTRSTALQPQLVVDMLGYNMGYEPGRFASDRHSLMGDNAPHWVRDLMLDCSVDVKESRGELTLEINGGVDQCRARFDLATGVCTLSVTRHESPDGPGREIAATTASTPLNQPGKHHVQLANFDDRLTLWVDGRLMAQDGLEYPTIPPSRQELRGPRVSDLNPVSIGAKDASVSVSNLQIWRDIYYVREAGLRPDFGFAGQDRTALGMAQFLSLSPQEMHALPPRAKVEKWYPYYQHDPRDYRQLGPDEYFALGDNSTRSSDSRDWEAVPQRLLLGKAVWVYWPLGRFGLIR